MRWRPLLIVAAGLVAMAMVMIVGLFAFRDLSADAVRRVLVPRLEAITHRDVAITGAFELVPSLTPTLAAEGLAIANAPWGSRPAMLQADRVEVEVQLLPLLLRRDIVIDRLTLVGADVLLERGPDGHLNWSLDLAGPEPAGRQREFLLSELSVEASQLTWRDAATKRSETVRIGRLAWHAVSASDDIILSGAGEFEGQPFSLSGELGSLATLRQGAEPYPAALELSVGTAQLALEGQLSAQREMRFDVRLSGPSVAALGEQLGRHLPDLGAYRLEGELAGPIEHLALDEVSGTIGSEAVTSLQISDGRIERLLAGAGIGGRLVARGEELARLAGVLGFEMAPFGPYRAEGTLAGSFAQPSLRELSATAGDQGSRIELAGAIEDALALEGVKLAVTVAGENLAELSPLARVDLPTSQPYRMSGDVSGSLADLRIDALQVALANSTVGGWLAVHRPESGITRIEGEIVADRLDVDRMVALAEGARSDAREASAATLSGNGQDRPSATAALPLEVLNEVEAEVTVRADHLEIDPVDFADTSAKIVLRGGRLSIQDLVAQVGRGGTVAGNAAVEAAAGGAEISVRLSADDIPLGELLSDIGATDSVTGKVNLDINIDSTGRSIEELMGDLQGSAAIVAEDGRIEDGQLDRLVTDLDVLRALPPFWRRNDTVRVNCLVGNFDIEHGVARTGAVLDTRRMTLLGQGSVDLATQTLNLQLRPIPKEQKLSTLAIPVDIEGSLENPEIKPRTGTAAAQAVRGVLGGLLIPLNQISALFGQQTVDACVDALRQARDRREQQTTGTQPPT